MQAKEADITYRDVDFLILDHPSVKLWLWDKPDSTVYNNYGRNLVYFTNDSASLQKSYSTSEQLSQCESWACYSKSGAKRPTPKQAE